MKLTEFKEYIKEMPWTSLSESERLLAQFLYYVDGYDTELLQDLADYINKIIEKKSKVRKP